MADLDALVQAARAVAARAYAPYSKFRVGAAILDADGRTHVGCNVESASYGLTLCAERNAIFSAIAAGAPRPFSAIALTCLDGACTPCGACRQIISEHLPADAPVQIDGGEQYSVADLLPHAFRLSEV
ncbi:MAG: cytidine deaminase [Chloroflexi bacterium]|nr:cytidine deaminase [Chloroflexota bacterium]